MTPEQRQELAELEKGFMAFPNVGSSVATKRMMTLLRALAKENERLERENAELRELLYELD